MLTGTGFTDRLLNTDEFRSLVSDGLSQASLAGKRVLVIIPDGTRSIPIGDFFRRFHELLWGEVAALDYLIALGTHQPMSEQAIQQRLGISAEEMEGRYAGVRIFNHRWENPDTFHTLGEIPAADIEEMTGGLLSMPVKVTINRMIFDYDQIIVCGPVFPHEVVGFSGGNKYFFPGISGPEIIHLTHWLSALVTNVETIGVKRTAVRAVIDRAAEMIEMPKLFVCSVIKDDSLAGLYIGSHEEAWSAAADLSAQINIKYVDHPFQQVLSVLPELYDEIWTGSKGMYKLEPVVADGGEVILYAPNINEISFTHGHVLDQTGYHVRDYFVKQWDRFKGFPWGVLAHATLLRGLGTYEDGVEKPRIKVTLATGISREWCERINLGYRDPATIDPTEWAGREDEGILLVPHAGEKLYRLKSSEA